MTSHCHKSLPFLHSPIPLTAGADTAGCSHCLPAARATAPRRDTGAEAGAAQEWSGEKANGCHVVGTNVEESFFTLLVTRVREFRITGFFFLIDSLFFTFQKEPLAALLLVIYCLFHQQRTIRNKTNIKLSPCLCHQFGNSVATYRLSSPIQILIYVCKM